MTFMHSPPRQQTATTNFRMQPTAAMRFFEVPELVAHLARHFLDHKSISCLMRTTRQLHAFLTPTLYYNVYCHFDNSNCLFERKKATLLSSKESIRVLARNAHFVRQLDLHHLDMIYYMHCVFAYQDQVSIPPSSSAGAVVVGVQEAYEKEEEQEEEEGGGLEEQGQVMIVSRRRRPRWLAPPDPRICTVFPIPLMTRLTRLDLDLNDCILTHGCPYFYADFKRNPRATLTQTCWLLDSNPHLRVLRLSNILMKDHRDTRLLTRSIFGLKQLQDAEFGLVRCEEEEEGWGPKATRGLAFAVFYACPPLLSRFCFEVTEKELYLQDDMAEEYWEAEPGKPQFWEMMDGDEMREGEMMMTAPPRWLREEEPLLHLTSLKLRDMGEENISEDELRSMLAHCPNLTEIELPCVVPVKDIQRLALDIAHSLCPRLTILEENRNSGERRAWHGLAVRIVDALPEHQVQRLRCLGLSFAIPNLLNSSDHDTRPIFRRHSQTLREVVLWSCWEISSKTIQMILVECLALERLDARSATRTPRRTFNDLMEGIPFRGEFSIDLQDAVEFPWGCTSIKDLRLTISIPDLYDDDDDDEDDDDDDNDNQPTSPTTVATAAEDMTATALFQRLESLYRQLGALMELERLYLQAVFYDPEAHCHLPRTYWLSTFPGMLLDTTGDGGPGGGSGDRPAGYLHLLGGLTRLKDLYVSSRSPRKEKNNLTIGVEELKWMGKHWPMLEETSPITKRIKSL